MSEITKTTERPPNFNNRIIWLTLAALIVINYFIGLNIPLMGPDEPRYSQVAREMFLSGDWVTPRLGGFTWFEKPALLYWLQAAFYTIFGVSEFAARFGSALFGIGTILSLWILGKQSLKSKVQSPKSETERNQLTQTSETKAQSPKTENSHFTLHASHFSNWFALIAASSVGLITFSHAASFDIILTFPLTAALIAFFLSEQLEKRSSYYYLLLTGFYFFIGVALIGKGLVGIVFPFAIVAFYYLLSWKLPSRSFLLSLIWGTIISLLVAGIWYVPVYQANGWKFIDEFIIQHHFQRFTSDKYQHHQPFWFFFLVLPLMTIPWLPFFLISIWEFLKDFFQRRTQTTNYESRITNYELRLFAFAWMLVPLVFFSLSGSKLPGYILPSLPPALILTAEYIYRFVQNRARRELILQAMAAIVFIFTILALQFYVKDHLRDDTDKEMIAAADAQGYSNAKILSLYVTSHNAEFYGAGRLLRNADGTQKHFDGPAEIYQALETTGQPELVIVPIDGIKYLTESNLLNAKVLADNGSLAIVAVERK